MRIRAARDHVLHADGTLFDRVDRLPPRYCGPLNRLAASRLLLPRSGLERSDFVLWPECDMPISSSNVRSQQYTGKHLLRLSSSQFGPPGLASYLPFVRLLGRKQTFIPSMAMIEQAGDFRDSTN